MVVPGPPPARCKSCRAPIFWARSATTGSRMPIDVAPHPDGNVVIVDWSTEKPPLPVVRVLGTSADVEVPRYMPHHATCPDAQEWRR